jgi:hypothetical protein
MQRGRANQTIHVNKLMKRTQSNKIKFELRLKIKKKKFKRALYLKYLFTFDKTKLQKSLSPLSILHSAFPNRLDFRPMGFSCTLSHEDIGVHIA